MEHDLSSKTIAILATDGFEESELVEPKKALEQAGATVHVVSPSGERTIRGGQRTLRLTAASSVTTASGPTRWTWTCR